MQITKRKKMPSRGALYPKDVQLLTGLNYRSACRFYNKLLRMHGKEKGNIVTIPEFCGFTKIDFNFVIQELEIGS